MLDWLTCHVEFRPEYQEEWSAFLGSWRHWARCDSGEVVATKYDWQRLRSDAREVSVVPRVCGVTLAGSPSAALGEPNNVFGSSDGEECLEGLMRAGREVLAEKGWRRCWWDDAVTGVKVTRVDVTQNILLESPEHVRWILAGLQGIETGKYRTTRKYGSSVYFGGKESRRKGKVYNKGLHLRQLKAKGVGHGVSETDMVLLERVARLELELGRHYWKDHDFIRDWRDLEREAADYWEGLFGSLGTVDMELDEYARVEKYAKSCREARAVFRTLELIRSVGPEAASLTTSRATWFRHRSVLVRAGFGAAELAGVAKVVQFPVRELFAQRVDSWEELRRAA